MKLAEYLEKRGMSVAGFATAIETSYPKIRHVISGGIPSLKTALSIEEYTKEHPTIKGDWVSFQDLMGLIDDQV